MGARPGGERLRRLREVGRPDPRWKHFVVQGERLELWRSFGIQDLHRSIRYSILHAGVPDVVWVQFETARNLSLYSWYVYRFSSLAEFLALSALEAALRHRLLLAKKLPPKKRWGLQRMLKEATDQGWIRAEKLRAFRVLTRAREQSYESLRLYGLQFGEAPKLVPAEYLKQLTKVLPMVRNELAHGKGLLMKEDSRTLRVCADLINQLYDRMRGGR
jgi:hypothetical protein